MYITLNEVGTPIHYYFFLPSADIDAALAFVKGFGKGKSDEGMRPIEVISLSKKPVRGVIYEEIK